MQNSSSTSMPIIETKVIKVPHSYICILQMFKDYQILIKRIIHLIIKIDPNLIYFVSQLAKFSNNLIDKH